MDIRAILNDVPDYKRFLTVREMDENSRALAAKYAGTVEVFEAGKSRNGYPITCMKIGKGKKNALIFGCPHPNEPIGAMMLEYLTERLAKDEALRKELDFTWYIIKCSDPDGTMLNEGWFDGPFSPLNYAKDFFRPASHQQVEWTFPIDYKTLHFHSPIPETKALMNVIDSVKPDFGFSLHNAGFGGAYWYLSDEAAPLYDQFPEFAKWCEVPLSLGEPEMPYAVKYAQAIYRMPGSRDTYDYYEKFTSNDPASLIKGGTSSADYAKTVADTFAMVCEVPYFYDPRIEDLSPSDMVRKDAILISCDRSLALYDFVIPKYEAIKDLLGEDNPFRITLDDFLTSGPMGLQAKRRWAETDPACRELATVAEKFDNLQVSRFYNMLTMGLLMRAAKYEKERGKDGTDRLDAVEQEALQLLEKTAAELDAELQYTVIPIRRLVGVQLGSALAAAEFVRDRK